MSITLNEKGIAISEEVEGVSMPIDCSFEMVNGWIHGADVQFEELQALCLGMASENDRLRAQLAEGAPVRCDKTADMFEVVE